MKSTLTIAAMLGLAGSAFGQVNIADGDASFALANGASGNGTFSSDGGASDDLFESWFMVGQNGAAEDRIPFPTNFVNSGSVSTGDVDDGSTNYALRYEIADTGFEESVVLQCLTITNNGSAPVDYAVFAYIDYDVDNSTQNVGELFTDDIMLVTNPMTGQFNFFEGVDRLNYEADTFATLRSKLTDGAADALTNTGMPFGLADWTGAFEWRYTLQPGESIEIKANLGIGEVPAPGAMALLGLGGLAAARRRR